MKNILILSLLCFAILSCKTESQDDMQLVSEKVIELNIENPVSITENPLSSGRIISVDEITYYQIELFNLDGFIRVAEGVYDELPTNISMVVIDNSNYRLSVRALRKGTSFGIQRNGDQLGVDNFGPFPITNILNYDDPSGFWNFSGRVIAHVYQDADSLVALEQDNPAELDTYFKSIEFNSGSTTSLDISLERESFGLEVVAEDFTEGTITVEIGDLSPIYSIELAFPTDSAFHILSPSTSYRTVVSYNDGTNDIPLYNQILSYSDNKIKRFEINPGMSSNRTDAVISISEVELVRGDTLQIGG